MRGRLNNWFDDPRPVDSFIHSLFWYDANMSTEITLSLPEELVEQAEILASRTGRQVDAVLNDVLQLSLSSVGSLSKDRKPWADCENEEVLSACEISFDENTEARFSELLERQRAKELTDTERSELAALMQRYKDGLLLKAEAIHEAVRRGIRPSPA